MLEDTNSLARIGDKYQNWTNTNPSLTRLRLFTSELFKRPISLYRVTPGVDTGFHNFGLKILVNPWLNHGVPTVIQCRPSVFDGTSA